MIRVVYNHGAEFVTARDLIARSEASAVKVAGSPESWLYHGALCGALEVVVEQLCRDLEASQSGRLSARWARARMAELTGAAS